MKKELSFICFVVGVCIISITGSGCKNTKSSNLGSDTITIDTVSYDTEEVVAKEKLEVILKELVGIADIDVIPSKVNKYCTEEFKTGFNQAWNLADKGGCEYPRLWWSYSDDDPSKYEITKIVMTSNNVAKADVKISGEMYIGRFNVLVKKEKDAWLIDKIDEVETVNNPDFDISDNVEGSSNSNNDISWLQGHWVYDVLNRGGYYQGRIHVEINGDRIIQYRNSHSESKNPAYTIEDGKIKAFFYDDMQTEYPLDMVNHRIGLGDGHWMYRLGSDKDYQRARGFTSEISIFKKLENKNFIRYDTFENIKEVESIKFDGEGKLYIDGKYEGTVSVDEYTLEKAKLSLKGEGYFSNTQITVDIDKGMLWFFYITMTTDKLYYKFKLSDSDRAALIRELRSE